MDRVRWAKAALGCCALMSLFSINIIDDARAKGVTSVSWHGKVVWVPDGDTIYVRRFQTVKGKLRLQGRRLGVHLAEIDAPEPKMAYGKKAAAFTRKLVLGKVVRIKTVTKDRYGRVIAHVYASGKHLNAALIEEGLAWHYKRYSRSKSLAVLESNARRLKRGLWSQPKPVSPWVWRKQRRAVKAKTLAKAPIGRVSGRFRGNERSKVYHAPGCRYFRCKNCTKVLKGSKQAKKLGYRPHKRCVRKFLRKGS